MDRDKGIYLINPGSCGLPLDGIRDSAPYTVLEITDDGHVIIEEKRIPFDKAEYVSKVKNSAQYQEANVWSQVILREQTTALEQYLNPVPIPAYVVQNPNGCGCGCNTYNACGC